MWRDLRKRRMDSNGQKDELNKRVKIFSDSHSSLTTTRFEDLPNEIFRDIFDYLLASDVLHSLYGLNSRFNSIICQMPMKVRFDPRKRQQLTRFLKQLEPRFFSQIVALDYAAVYFPENYFDRFIERFPFDQLLNLRDLSVTTDCFQALESFLRFVPQMKQLRSFRLLDRFAPQPIGFCVCQMILANNRQCGFSSRNSLKHISIETTPPFRTLILVQKVLSNQIIFNSLRLKIFCSPAYHHVLIHLPLANFIHFVPQMTYCHVNLYQRPHTIVLGFLRSFPKISHLSIRTSAYAYANGDQWEEILNQCPNITNLDLDIHLEKSDSDEEILSFQTKFWYERRWIVQVKPNKTNSNQCSFYYRTCFSSER